MNLIFTAHNCNLSFIENELRYLLNHPKVNSVKVYTDFPIEDNSIAFHDKCFVLVFKSSNYSLLKLRMWPWILNEFMFNIPWYFRYNRFRELYTVLRDHLRKASLILENGIDQKDILYSFWAGSGAFIISSLKQSDLNNLSVSRLHAFDIYEDGDNNGHIPWRQFIYSNLDKLVTISKHGENYLLKKYSFTKAKVNTIQLGIPRLDHELNEAPKNEINLVSCSWVGSRKNLSGIFQALKSEKNMTWTHIGDGEDFDQLKQVCLNNSVELKVNLPGKQSQEGIHEFYNANLISCFISLSTNEGLPVSMMEAMAHGIPVVSTDVGGCSEIVNENTGVLLPKNYTDEDVRKAVYLCAEKFSSRESRQKIQDFIKDNFDAEKNYGKFVDFLEAENKKHHEKL